MTKTRKASPGGRESLTPDEIDAIGEILNISMGASATAVSVMLSRQVSITTPSVSVVRAGEFTYDELEPAIGIEIEYIEGLNGSSLMIMSVRDIKKIIGLLIPGSEDMPEGDEMDEMHTSALGEIMNQMMGASSTAIASMLNAPINISPPKPFDLATIGDRFSSGMDEAFVVRVSFRLQVENLLDSEFITVLPVAFTKALVRSVSALDESDNNTAPAELVGHTQVPNVTYSEDYEEEEAAPVPSAPAPAPAPVRVAPRPAAAAAPRSAPKRAHEERRAAAPVHVEPLHLGPLDESKTEGEQVDLDLVMDVELTVTVEIGRRRRQLKDVLALHQGSIVELDKQAGEPVDVVVNGQLIARGDVVVIDEHFGVRITEIVSKD